MRIDFLTGDLLVGSDTTDSPIPVPPDGRIIRLDPTLEEFS